MLHACPLTQIWRLSCIVQAVGVVGPNSVYLWVHQQSAALSVCCLSVVGHVASSSLSGISSAVACTVSSLLTFTRPVHSFSVQLPAVNRHLKLSRKPLQE